MLNLACRNTAKLIREQSKTENVRLGRLFTKKDTARRMAEMFDLDPDRRSYTVLDPGAGTGILSAALVEEICKIVPACRQIFLTCFETDPLFLPMLRDNLERIRKKINGVILSKIDVTPKLWTGGSCGCTERPIRSLYRINSTGSLEKDYRLNFNHSLWDEES